MAAASDSIGNNFIEKYIDVVDMQDLTNKQKLDANELFQSEISSHIYENKKKMKCSIKLYPLNLIGEHVILWMSKPLCPQTENGIGEGNNGVWSVHS